MRWGMEKSFTNKKRKWPAYEIVVFAVLTVYSLIIAGLFIWAFLSSFRTHDNFRSNPLGVFTEFNFSNYKYVFNSLKSSYYEGKAKVGKVNCVCILTL